MGISEFFSYPGPLPPPEAHQDPEWQPVPAFAFYSVHMVMADCQRVSWGSFERPIRMVLESHGAINNPPSCDAPPQTVGSRNIIHSLWINDRDLADYLRTTYDGLTVFYSEIDAEISISGPLHEYTWSWGPQDGQRTVLTNADDGEHARPRESYDRFFFWNQTRAASIDLRMHADESPSVATDLVGSDMPTRGKVYAPMLAAGVSEDYAGKGSRLEGMDLSAEIKLYKDHQCTE